MTWSIQAEFISNADAVLDVVRNEVDWTQQMASRETASMGIPYNYAGASYPEAAWHPVVAAVCEAVGKALGFVPTNCLLNRYRTGQAAIGWHRDDVDILEPGTPIAIVSLGHTRTMQLRSGDGPFIYDKVVLEHGSLLVMSAAMQTTHKHAIKRESRAGERISLTFRHLTHAPPPVVLKAWGQ